MKTKTSYLIILIMALWIPTSLYGQKSNDSIVNNGDSNFRYNQYIMVELKDGREVPAKIASIISNKKILAMMLTGNRKGMVRTKFVRHMTPEEKRFHNIKDFLAKSDSQM